jgi:hypothetical protein
VYDPFCHTVEASGPAIHILSFIYSILRGQRENNLGRARTGPSRNQAKSKQVWSGTRAVLCHMADQARRSDGISSMDGGQGRAECWCALCRMAGQAGLGDIDLRLHQPTSRRPLERVPGMYRHGVPHWLEV